MTGLRDRGRGDCSRSDPSASGAEKLPAFHSFDSPMKFNGRPQGAA
jgi:hypothetical protein